MAGNEFDLATAGIGAISSVGGAALQNMQSQQLANSAQSFDVAQTQWQTMANQQQNLESQAFNAQQAADARQFDISAMREAAMYTTMNQQQQQAYETQMSNTAYQRSRQDMIAAGLNPMAMAGMGGASTPSVSAATIGAPSGPSATSGPGVGAEAARGRVASLNNIFAGLVSNAVQAGQASVLADKYGSEGRAADASAGLSGQLKSKGVEDTRAAAADADTARARANVAEAEALNKVTFERAKNDLYKTSPGLLSTAAKGSLINEGSPKDLGGGVWRILMELGDWATRNKAGFTPTSPGPSNAQQLANQYSSARPALTPGL